MLENEWYAVLTLRKNLHAPSLGALEARNGYHWSALAASEEEEEKKKMEVVVVAFGLW
jgi:hypothetical protein